MENQGGCGDPQGQPAFTLCSKGHGTQRGGDRIQQEPLPCSRPTPGAFKNCNELKIQDMNFVLLVPQIQDRTHPHSVHLEHVRGFSKGQALWTLPVRVSLQQQQRMLTLSGPQFIPLEMGKVPAPGGGGGVHSACGRHGPAGHRSPAHQPTRWSRPCGGWNGLLSSHRQPHRRRNPAWLKAPGVVPGVQGLGAGGAVDAGRALAGRMESQQPTEASEHKTCSPARSRRWTQASPERAKPASGWD